VKVERDRRRYHLGMHTPELILTLTGALSAALALGYLTHRLGLSPIVGYLLAGVAIGEYTPGFRASRELAQQLAEVGVILLMFGVGLHFHVEDLLAVRRVAVPGAVAQIAAATAMGTLVGAAFGWSWSSAVVFGLCVSVASTVVLTRVLGDRNELHTPLGHTAVGWLVVQDLFAVFFLVLMPSLFGGDGGGAGRVAEVVGLAALKIVALAAIVFAVGGRVIPWLLRHVAATHSRELFTLTVLVVAIGIAVGSNELFGVSMALGAFLAGMVVGRSEFSLRAATEALPMRDAFAVLFFVSVGMLFDPGFLIRSPGLVTATLAVVMLGTPLVTTAVMLAMRRPLRSAIGMGLALGQIGEFSFILATLATSPDLRLLPPEAMNALVAVAIVSISVNPLLYRLAGPIDAWIARRPRLARNLAARVRLERSQAAAAARAADENVDPRFRAVVVGYGPVGRTLVRLLQENGIEPTVIEMNLETVRRLRGEGLSAVYGDAAHLETLKEAGVQRAASLFLTASGVGAPGEVIRIARELNPNVRVLARSSYLRERPDLFKAGADAVFAGEGEIALAMNETVLRELGATPDQIDRERERVREELFGAVSPPAVNLPTPPAEPEKLPVPPSDIPTVNVLRPAAPPSPPPPVS
jgi:CPA2 family monovalent cation:H+ antiporter-2